MTGQLARIARMPAPELAWRTHAALRIHADRWRTRLLGAGWNRGDLSTALCSDSTLFDSRQALTEERWTDAQEALTHHFTARSARFLISRSGKDAIVDRVTAQHPGARDAAIVQADALLVGRYDVLGYQSLRFSNGGAVPDWHYDPVHKRRAPLEFWSAVPYLDPSCGDHKIIWELNRHQHWLVLGRAYWLTGRRAYRTRVLAELDSWLAANPPLVGINWASMLELALRSLSWVWAIEFFAGDDERGDGPWLVDLLLGLDRQLTHVERNLSHYFSPNTHLIGEALALYVSGRVLPELAASGRREGIGRRILLAEMLRQIAADGGHCERSTHYHRYTLDFYLLALAVARITGDPIAGAFQSAVLRLARAARLLADDTGRLPHLGDDDGGMLLPLTKRPVDDIRDSLAMAAALTNSAELAIGGAQEEVLWVLSHDALIRAQPAAQPDGASSPSPRSAALAETGYFVSRSEAGDHLLIDGGPHGYQNAGHAHADALSMTFSTGGVPLLIDPGTGCYTVDPAVRDRLRSTACHNTLELGGRSQSLPRGPFHWQRTADTHVHRWRTTDGFDYFDGSHTGYLPAIHRRRVVSLHGEAIVVADLVDGPGVHEIAVHWHLAPQWTAAIDGRFAALTTASARIGLAVSGGRIERIVADERSGLGWWSPVYGRLEPTTTLRVTSTGSAPQWIVSVFDLNPRNPVRGVDLVALDIATGSLAHGTGVRIERADSIDYALFAEPRSSDQPVECRMADLETDARLLVTRVTPSSRVTHLAMLDGSLVRQTRRVRQERL